MSDIAKLLLKSTAYYKAAGLMEVPQNLLSKVQDYIIAAYARRLLDMYSKLGTRISEKKMRARNFKMAELKALLRKDLYRGAGHHLLFNLPIKNIPYIKDMIPNFNYGSTIQFRAKFTDHSPDDPKEMPAGSWMAHGEDAVPNFLGALIVYRDVAQDLASNNLEWAVMDMKNTVRHELIHLIQTAIAKHKMLDIAGIPGKTLREPNVDPYGQSHMTKQRLSHELQDIEFYAHLSDTVHEFQYVASSFPKPLHRLLARVWVGETPQHILVDAINEYKRRYNPPAADSNKRGPYAHAMDMALTITTHNEYSFFTKLHQYQPLKYQKAVKEFFKAVGV